MIQISRDLQEAICRLSETGQQGGRKRWPRGGFIPQSGGDTLFDFLAGRDWPLEGFKPPTSRGCDV